MKVGGTGHADTKVLFSWSGGKDSALALYEVKEKGGVDIVCLLTVMTSGYDRVNIHGVRRALMEQQAESLGIPLELVFIPAKASMEEYEREIQLALEKHHAAGVSSVVYGDAFLEDVKEYRDDQLSKAGMSGIYPIWKRDTREIASAFIELGFKAVITCVDSQALGGEFAGRVFDEEFLSDLPPDVDPCGENGEFHSFVFDGPLFKQAVPYTVGEVVLRENRFYYCDLIPVLGISIERDPGRESGTT